MTIAYTIRGTLNEKEEKGGVYQKLVGEGTQACEKDEKRIGGARAQGASMRERIKRENKSLQRW